MVFELIQDQLHSKLLVVEESLVLVQQMLDVAMDATEYHRDSKAAVPVTLLNPITSLYIIELARGRCDVLSVAAYSTPFTKGCFCAA